MKRGGAVLKAIAATAELTGAELSEAALLVFEADLSDYPEDQVLSALTRCRRELRGRLTVADVVERIASSVGHPTANEAWAMALKSYDEDETVVWTEQIAEAAAIAKPIFKAGDEVGARMAFRDAYDSIIGGSRSIPKWLPSLGCDAGKREAALDSGVRAGRLKAAHVSGLLPPPITEGGQIIAGLLSGQATEISKGGEIRERVMRLLGEVNGRRGCLKPGSASSGDDGGS